ncbi:MAG: chromosomal replication initiator protein DnaA, partial [Patescibacteria group bacterium]
AQVVAEKPGEVYNPLCLYGGVGLGKTHLMQAIGNAIHQNDPKKNIIYTSCESFTNDFIDALKEKEIGKFKAKYRGSDVLLIDDIQFLANKEGTQEEFFHTFNLLHQANRQIVITSDRVPKDIPDLEERLSSRFGWGMMADIQSPNYETRLAILAARADQLGAKIDTTVLGFIAQTVVSNVRELESCLTKLIANAGVEKAPITVEFAANTLKDFIKPPETVSAKKILNAVCRHFQLELTDLISRSRVAELVYPRQLAMYLMRVNAKLSLPQIGEVFGGKDHTTVIHSVRKITALVKSSSQTESDLNEIVNLLYQS